MSKIKSELIASGSYLPEKIMTNDDLSKIVDTNDEWISTRTGIKQRHIAKDDELTSDLAAKAAQNALKKSNLKAEDIDLIIVATTTPDLTFPSTAVFVQKKIGAINATAFDVQAVCSGFIYALSTADNFIKTGNAKNALVIGAETMSRIVDWKDRGTCVLFGDGAGAFLLQANERDDNQKDIIAYDIKSNPDYTDILKTDKGVSNGKTAGFISMNGREVFKLAVNLMADNSKELLKKTNIDIKSVDIIIPHQANKRIIDAIAKKLEVEEKKVISTVDLHANTSAATIPLAFDQSFKNGKIKENSLILLTALGAGITWGSVLIKI